MPEEPDAAKLAIISEYLATQFDGLQFRDPQRPEDDYMFRFLYKDLDYSLTVPLIRLTDRDISPDAMKQRLNEDDVAGQLRNAKDRTLYWDW